MFTPTSQQLAIRQEFQTGSRPFGVVARAGTGKTTMIFDGVRFMPELTRGWVLYLAFNKKIKLAGDKRNTNEAGETIIPRLEIKTIHSTGLRFVKQNWRDVQIDFGNDRADALTLKVCGGQVPEAIHRLVSKLHTKAREINPMAKEPGELIDLAIQHDCEPDEQYLDLGYDLAYVETRALEAMDLAAKVKPPTIDGADMIFLPIRNRWLRRVWQAVVVDEAQDMTPAQLQIALGVGSGRVIIIGDNRQAIYKFRGADAEGMDRLKEELNAKMYPMTITFRCGKRIVEAAQTLVPDLEAAPTNHEGLIREIGIEQLVTEVQPSDYVLSRLNAPLMPITLSILKAGKRANINGSDIGKGLIALVRKCATGKAGSSVPALLEKIAYWRDRQIARLQRAKRDQRHIDAVADKAEMLLTLAEAEPSTSAVIARIEKLFTDNENGDRDLVLCSSVHKIKGLETERVFILKDSLRSHTQEELNIQYVAMTRAKQELIWVRGGV